MRRLAGTLRRSQASRVLRGGAGVLYDKRHVCELTAPQFPRLARQNLPGAVHLVKHGVLPGICGGCAEMFL